MRIKTIMLAGLGVVTLSACAQKREEVAAAPPPPPGAVAGSVAADRDGDGIIDGYYSADGIYHPNAAPADAAAPAGADPGGGTGLNALLRGVRHRTPLILAFVPAFLALSTAPAAAHAGEQARASAVREDSVALSIREQAGGALKRFYADRGYRPLWAQGGRIGPAADKLIAYLASAELDGLRPGSYGADRLADAVAAARGGDAGATARAELMLSTAFTRYVRDQRGARTARMTYADKRLKPRKPRPETVLRAAAFPRSFDDYVAGMDWMSDQYVRLRRLTAAAAKQGASPEEMARLRLNLDRARLLPGPWTRHVVVDASSGRLWYYEAGRQVGTMRVVVGAAETQTPMLAGTLQWAILNPYWNVPDYLVRKNIAPKVLAGRTLDSLHMEALSDWSASPRRIDPAAIDWQAVAAGRQELRLRELPGGANSMGKVKFLFPNRDGIYLHDTPVRDLLKKDERHFSNGCIRLEDADALGKWLLQKPLRVASASKEPEQAVPLPVQVPVYLTYITAAATDGGVAFRDDVYGRDRRG